MFTIPELNVQLVDDKKEIVLFRLLKFVINFVKKDKLSLIDVVVHSVTVEDLVQPWGPRFNMLADSFIADYAVRVVDK